MSYMPWSPNSDHLYEGGSNLPISTGSSQREEGIIPAAEYAGLEEVREVLLSAGDLNEFIARLYEFELKNDCLARGAFPLGLSSQELELSLGGFWDSLFEQIHGQLIIKGNDDMQGELKKFALGLGLPSEPSLRAHLHKLTVTEYEKICSEDWGTTLGEGILVQLNTATNMSEFDDILINSVSEVRARYILRSIYGCLHGAAIQKEAHNLREPLKWLVLQRLVGNHMTPAGVNIDHLSQLLADALVFLDDTVTDGIVSPLAIHDK